jgi:glyoxylase-like metal-dependent hydrolase (beta-lactamase superfamily II)
MAKIVEFNIPYLAQFVKSYLIETENYNIFIDGGIKRNEENIRPYLQNGKKNVCIVTHGHWDHIGLCSAIQAAGGILYGNARDKRYYTDFDWDWQVGFEQYKEDCNIPPERSDLFWSEIGNVAPLDKFVWDGDMLTFDDVTLKIMELPGHTRGSIGIYLPDDDILFTGDALMGPGFFGGCTQYCDYLGYVRSMEKIIALNPKTIYTAHTEALTDHTGTELAKVGLETGKAIEKTVDEYLSTFEGAELSVPAIAKVVAEKIGRNFGGGACVSVISHLALCKAQDARIEKCLEKYVYGV